MDIKIVNMDAIQFEADVNVLKFLQREYARKSEWAQTKEEMEAANNIVDTLARVEVIFKAACENGVLIGIQKKD